MDNNNEDDKEWVDIYNHDVEEVLGLWRRKSDKCLRVQLKVYDAHPMIDPFAIMVHKSSLINAILVTWSQEIRVLKIELKNDRGKAIIRQELPDTPENNEKGGTLLEVKSGGGIPVIPLLHQDFKSLKNEKIKIDVTVNQEGRKKKILPKVYVFYQEDTEESSDSSCFSSDEEDNTPAKPQIKNDLD